MVLLEHEIFKTNFEWDYASHYVNHLYGEDDEDSFDTNIELLLGVQQWRHCVFCPVPLMEARNRLAEMTDEEKDRYYSLLAIGDQNGGGDWENEEGDFEIMEMAFDDGAPMPEAAGAPRGE